MKNAASPKGNAARQSHRISTDDSTTPVPIFQQLVAEAERFTLWRYTIRDIGELTMVSLDPITRAEAEKSIRVHFGDRLLFLRPGGGE